MNLIKICPSCEMKNQNSGIFCRGCGADISAVSFLPEQELYEEKNSDSPPASSDITLKEPRISSPSETASFSEYTIITQLDSGGEADIYRMKKQEKDYILKLYRFGCDPKEDVLKKVKQVSERFSEFMVRIYEYGFEPTLKRWFEIQEFISGGTLEEYLTKLPVEKLADIVEKIAEALSVIHRNRIIHLDLKPSNILMRCDNTGMHPVFTDFGISSLIDDEISKKMTLVKGTPLYWSPESFTGIVGKKSDFWSLGMIILEYILKKHPFRGLDMQVIMFALSTRGVEVSGNIEPKIKKLLKGLLTRDPSRRWGTEEIQKWAAGEDVPVFYDYREIKEGITPYIVEGMEYYDISSVLIYFMKGPEQWQSGADHIQKGFIEKWLEKNQEYDAASKLSRIREQGMGDKDMALLRAVYTFTDIEGLVYAGKLITLENLYIFVLRVLKKEADSAEQTIINNLCSGNLIRYYREYLKLTAQSPDSLFEIIDGIDRIRRSEELFYRVFDFWLFPEKYYTAFEKVTDEQKLEIIRHHAESLILKTEFAALQETYFIPESIKQELESGDFQKLVRAARNLSCMKKENLFVEKKSVEFNRYRELLSSARDFDQYVRAAGFIRQNIEMSLYKKIPDIHFKLSRTRFYGAECERILKYLEKLQSGEIRWENADKEAILLLDNVYETAEDRRMTLLRSGAAAFICSMVFYIAGLLFLNNVFVFYLILLGILAVVSVKNDIVTLRKNDTLFFSAGIWFIGAFLLMIAAHRIFENLMGIADAPGVALLGFLAGGLVSYLFFYDGGRGFRAVYNEYKSRIDEISGVITSEEFEIFKSESGNNPHLEVAQDQSRIEVTAEEICNAYEKDCHAADSKYLGKYILLKDRIGSIGKTRNSEPYIKFFAESGQYSTVVRKQFSGVNGYFALSQEEQIQKLSSRDYVEIVGRCAGAAEGIVVLRDCRVIKSINF